MGQGTGQDIDQVVDMYSDMVYRLAYAQTKNRHDADDIYQEVFLRYVKKRPGFASEEHRKAWFLRVTINCGKKLWSSAWRRKTVPLEDRPAAPAASIDLSLALDELPPNYRAVIHLFYYEDLTAEEIGKLLGRKPSTVRMQLTRARAQLKDLLKGE